MHMYMYIMVEPILRIYTQSNLYTALCVYIYMYLQLVAIYVHVHLLCYSYQLQVHVYIYTESCVEITLSIYSENGFNHAHLCVCM